MVIVSSPRMSTYCPDQHLQYSPLMNYVVKLSSVAEKFIHCPVTIVCYLLRPVTIVCYLLFAHFLLLMWSNFSDMKSYVAAVLIQKILISLTKKKVSPSSSMLDGDLLSCWRRVALQISRWRLASASCMEVIHASKQASKFGCRALVHSPSILLISVTSFKENNTCT